MYAGVCARYWLAAGQISEDDFEKIQVILDDGMKPEISLLKRCFPKAVSDYLNCIFCQEGGYEADFSYASVANHWRYHHKGETPVNIATVISVLYDGVHLVVSDGKTVTVENPYNVSTRARGADRVAIHNKAIIEKI
jgi:hypothetical protein